MTTRPNLLFIYSDQHNPYVMGCAGDPVVSTPNLDSLAAKGVLATDVYTPSPVCVPARMSMLSGRYPHEIDTWTNSHIMDSAVPTLAHSMGAAGYNPVLAGRMHFLGPDQLHGYSDRIIGDHSSLVPGTGDASFNFLEDIRESGPGGSGYQVIDEDTTAVAVEWLNRFALRKRASREEEPFNLTVGYILPHSPYIARKEDYDRYAGRVKPPTVRLPFSDLDHPFDKWWREHVNLVSPPEEDLMKARAAYWALVERLDTNIGLILDALRANGLDENTIIVYSTDHGDMVGERELWMKRCFYEPSVKVPAIISWPEVLPQGVQCDRVMNVTDLNATILSALGAPQLPGSHGRNAIPMLRGEDDNWDDIAISEYAIQEGSIQRMVRKDNWKFIYHHEEPAQLFDLSADPNELNDRSQDSDCAEIVSELSALVFADGWDPNHVRQRLKEKKRDTDLIRKWAENCPPEDQYRWDMDPSWTYVE